MNRKTEVDYQEDPYEVIRRMRAALEDQRAQIEEYEIVCNSLAGEKNAALSEANEAKN